MYSIEQFVESVSKYKQIDSSEVLLEFYEMCNSKRTAPEAFDEFCNWAPLFLKDSEELKFNLVDPSDFYRELVAFHELEKFNESDVETFQARQVFWKSLKQRDQNFENKLRGKGYSTIGMMYKELIDLLPSYLKQTSLFHVFVGFNALNKAEEILFQSLLNAKKGECYWDLDSELHQNKFFSGNKFINKYQKEWDVYKGKPYKFIDKNYEQPKSIRTYGFSQNTGQAKQAALLLSDELKTHKTEKTAVVLGDQSLLVPFLSGLAAKESEYFVTMGYPLSNAKIASFIQHLFEAQQNFDDHRFYLKDVLGICTNSVFINFLRDEKEKYSTQLIKIRNYRSKRIGIDSLKAIFGKKAAEMIFNPFLSTKMYLFQLNTILEIYKEAINPANQPFEYSATQIFIEKLEKLKNKQFILENISNPKELNTLWQEITSEQSIGLKGNRFSNVQIMGLLETRNLDFDNVIITNFNEGIFPKGKGSQSLFPLSLKIKYKIPVFTESDAIYTYHFYRLIQRAKNIHLIFNSEEGNLGAGEKSRFLNQLKLNPHINHTFVSEVISSPVPQIVDEIPEDLKSKEFYTRLNEIAERGFSPSSLSSYLLDPLVFYRQKILSIQEENLVEENLNVMEMGTIAHQSLEELYKPFLEQHLTLKSFETMKNRLDEVIQAEVEKIIKARKTLRGQNLLSVVSIRHTILYFLEKEQKVVAEGNTIYIKALEKDFCIPIYIEELQRTVQLRGQIDRVDLFNGQLRILDYKTGNIEARELKITDFEKIRGSLKKQPLFQLLAYAYSMWASKEMTSDEEFCIGIISLRSRNTYVLPAFIEKQNSFLHQEVLVEYEAFLKGIILELFTSPTLNYSEGDSR